MRWTNVWHMVTRHISLVVPVAQPPHRVCREVFTEWAHLAQDRAGWHKLVTAPPFAIGKPFVRQPRGDTRVTPEDKRRAVVQRAAEIAERRAVFDANNNN